MERGEKKVTDIVKIYNEEARLMKPKQSKSLHSVGNDLPETLKTYRTASLERKCKKLIYKQDEE